MLVSLIVHEPAAFQLSPDGVIKQMGCDDVDHKPDDPLDAAPLAALRAALPRPEDALNRNSVAAAGMERMARCRQRGRGIDAGLQVFFVALGAWWQDDATSATARRPTRD